MNYDLNVFVLQNTFLFFRNKDEISDERLAGARIFVLPGSREKFSQAEVSELTKQNKNHTKTHRSVSFVPLKWIVCAVFDS